ncbi:phage integrase SAM-like domain-containing protein [Fulvivirga sp. 2943]|uniref:Phage integrase SAM-like domain-containing protein n=1 Tax=Fulvivirga sediminis TaxID=2803949 RepID=A0A937FAA1_9BACT|nr:phage integrase SAM-like domain-containing protein [Fulvivirga sediminis]
MKYIRMLKKVLNDAIRRDWIKSNPLSSFKWHFKWPKREVLSMKEFRLYINIYSL